ncbi:MAG: hypothetical protein ACLFPW_12815 [Spirochaetaceae bacterium]
MPRRSYSGDKRRRQLDKKKKQEQKRKKKAERAENPEEDQDAYKEYLNPGGPVDHRFVEEESAEESDEASEDEE